MPSERRTLRSSKELSSSANGEKPRSNSQSSSSNKDKAVPTRSTSSKGKTLPSKKGTNSLVKDPSGDKSQTNGDEPIENGVNGVEDIEMADDGTEKMVADTSNDGDDEMTVVVPPPKSSKLAGESAVDPEGDTPMEVIEKADVDDPEAEEVDPRVKAISGWFFNTQHQARRWVFLSVVGIC